LEIYLNKPIEKISQEFWSREQAEEAERQNRVAEAKSSKEILDYYKTTERYLYELIYWEALKSKQIEFKKVYLFCSKMKINRLLDFGGGVGGLSIFMAQRGLKCDYLDVPGKTSDFAKWRFRQRNLEINSYANAETLPPSAYNAVIAFDVLEHLFDVEEAIGKTERALRNKGYFISRSTFGDAGLHLPKNKKFQDIKVFNAMMEKYNFRFMGQLKPHFFCQFLKNLGFKYISFGCRTKKRLKYGGNFIVYQKEGKDRCL
jgi:2-polyprenyl-3-methyl-5-hydroxy-6-metoxy-1,4-benzoquinol methylase